MPASAFYTLKTKDNHSVVFCVHGLLTRRSLPANQLYQPYAHHGADRCNDEAVEIEAGYPCTAKKAEQPAPEERPDNADNNIHNESL